MATIQFGVNVRAVSGGHELRQLVQRADALGYDVLAAPGHRGTPAPLATLAAAALVSARLRLRTCVLNVGFWNAAPLAHEWPPSRGWSAPLTPRRRPPSFAGARLRVRQRQPPTSPTSSRSARSSPPTGPDRRRPA